MPQHHPLGRVESDRKLSQLPCPRARYSELSELHPEIAGVRTQVAPHYVNAEYDGFARYARLDGSPLRTLPAVPWADFAHQKYVLVMDGTTAAAKLAKALATGAVVLLPNSSYEQWFEPELVAWKHFVPLWQEGIEDIFPRLAFLEANPAVAERIGHEARSFACKHLVPEGRACWWREMVRVYRQSLMTYDVDDALVRLRLQQFPDMLRVTPRNLACVDIDIGPSCLWNRDAV